MNQTKTNEKIVKKNIQGIEITFTMSGKQVTLTLKNCNDKSASVKVWYSPPSHNPSYEPLNEPLLKPNQPFEIRKKLNPSGRLKIVYEGNRREINITELLDGTAGQSPKSQPMQKKKTTVGHEANKALLNLQRGAA